MSTSRPEINFNELQLQCEEALTRFEYGLAFRICEGIIKFSKNNSRAKKIKNKLSKNAAAVTEIKGFIKKTEPDIQSQHHLIGLANDGCFEDMAKMAVSHLKQKPSSVFLHQMAALAFSHLKRTRVAKNHFERALKMDPLNPQIMKNYGIFLSDIHDDLNARKILYYALQLNRGNEEIISVLAALEMRLRHFSSAEILYQQAINISSENGENLLTYFKCLSEQNKISSARKIISKISQTPSVSWKASLCEAHLAIKMGNKVSALNILDRQLQDVGPKPEILLEKANLLKEVRKYKEAIALLEHIIKITPDFKDAKWNLSFLYLLTGNFSIGWQKYESRWESQSWNSIPFETSKPFWTGVESGNLFVWREQGIGDEIMFLSLIDMIPNTIKKIIVLCDPRLENLLEFESPLRVTILSDAENIDEREYDFHIPIGSLPKILKFCPSQAPRAPKSYLKVENDKITELRNLVCISDKKTIGLSWKSIGSPYGQIKNLSLSDMIQNLNSDKLEFVNLQYGDVSSDYRNLNEAQKQKINLVDTIDKRNDLEALSTLIKCCDSIVTTSNVTVHLASALGVECHLILYQNHDWKWHETMSHSYWYPSCRIYRYTSNDDLKHLFDTIRYNLLNISNIPFIKS